MCWCLTVSGREGSPVLAGLVFGAGLDVVGHVGEGVEGGVDADKGEFAGDDSQIDLPHVFEDAAHPVGGVVPACLGGAGGVAAALNRDEDARLTCGDGCRAGPIRGSVMTRST